MQIERGEWRDNPKPLPDGRMAIAIGDVHGCSRHLRAMYGALAEDVRDLACREVTCVLLGDLIDRGPDSLECLNIAAAGLDALVSELRVEDVALIGNHDAWLRLALQGRLDRQDAIIWDQNGGGDTWRSFGIDRMVSVDDLVGQLRDRLPDAAAWLVRGMVLHHRIGDLFFVHAGVDPRRRLDDQDEETMTWIRNRFLYAEDWPFDVLVVHGHTIEWPESEPEVHPHRIGLDSGAFVTGVLTAAEFFGARMRFVTVSAAES